MSVKLSKSEQTRLDRCAWALHKWAQIHGKTRRHARPELKTGSFADDTTVRVENQLKNAQTQRKTTLLGKYSGYINQC